MDDLLTKVTDLYHLSIKRTEGWGAESTPPQHHDFEGQKYPTTNRVNKSLEDGKFPNCLIKRISHQFSKQAHVDNILSKFQCGFRKGYENQHCLLLMLEIWKGATDNNKAFSASLTDFSKAFRSSRLYTRTTFVQYIYV